MKRLGGGKRYEAYLAWDDRLLTIVVAKMLRPDLVEEEGALRDLKREAEVLERLSHPVVVRGFDAVVDGPRPHIVLEHLEGPTLESLLGKYGPLPVEQLLPLGLNICSAIHYLSTEELVHLDVKPRNIVMGAPPRLIDLSIARTFDQAKRIKSPVGTDWYMAPEQCQPGAAAEIGPPADVWGLAVTLYEAITGRRPFSQEDAPGRPRIRFPQLTQDPFPFPKDVPSAVTQPVLSCLAKDPSERPTAARLAIALQPLVDALPHRPPLGRARPRFS